MDHEAFKANAAENLDLPKEVILDLPLMSVTGSGELIIDNFKSIREFSAKNVRINAKDLKISVYGENLSISCLTKETISVKGRFEKIEFL